MNRLEKGILIIFLSFAMFITIVAVKDGKQDQESRYIQNNFKSYQLSEDGDIQITLKDGSGYYFNIYTDVKNYRLINKHDNIYLYLNNNLSIKLHDTDINKIDITQSNYSNYKNSFIALEGEEFWNESTLEAGLNNELESYIYYLIYKL